MKKKPNRRPHATRIPHEARGNPIAGILRVIVPWPSTSEMKQLNPHAGGRGFKGKASATKNHRTTVATLVRLAWSGHEPLAHAKLRFVFYKPNAEHIDYLNMSQRMKAVIDGIADGGYIPGDDDRFLSISGDWELNIDRKHPRIELFLWRAEAPQIKETDEYEV